MSNKTFSKLNIGPAYDKEKLHKLTPNLGSNTKKVPTRFPIIDEGKRYSLMPLKQLSKQGLSNKGQLDQQGYQLRRTPTNFVRYDVDHVNNKEKKVYIDYDDDDDVIDAVSLRASLSRKPTLRPANDSIRELMRENGIVFTPRPLRKLVSTQLGLSDILLRTTTNFSKMKPKPIPKKIPFGSSIPRDFSKWQNLTNDYSKAAIKPHVPLKKKKEVPRQVTLNKSPFAKPGETRSEELMRVGQAIVKIPCRKRFSALKSRIIRRRVMEALHGERSDLERAKDYLQDWKEFERRRRPYYHEIDQDQSFLPKLSGDLIEKCLEVGVDFGLRRVHSDSDLEPGVYRQRYGKEDMYDGEIVICEKLSPKEVELLRNKPHRHLLKLLGPTNANLTDERLKERVIMLPIEARKNSLYDPANPLGLEEEETEDEIKAKAEKILKLGRLYKSPVEEDEEDLPPVIRQMKRAKGY